MQLSDVVSAAPPLARPVDQKDEKNRPRKLVHLQYQARVCISFHGSKEKKVTGVMLLRSGLHYSYPVQQFG